MSPKRLVFVAVVLAACASMAGGQCLVRKRVVAPVAAVQAAIVAPVAVTVPAYSASYDDSAALGNQVKDLQKRLAEVEGRLAALEGKPAPPGPPRPGPLPRAEGKGELPALYARSCVQCHKAGKVSGGLTLVTAEGKLAPTTCEQRLSILRRINLPAEAAEVMPPKKSKHEPASDVEAAELLELLTKP